MKNSKPVLSGGMGGVRSAIQGWVQACVAHDDRVRKSWVTRSGPICPGLAPKRISAGVNRPGRTHKRIAPGARDLSRRTSRGEWRWKSEADCSIWTFLRTEVPHLAALVRGFIPAGGVPNAKDPGISRPSGLTTCRRTESAHRTLTGRSNAPVPGPPECSLRSPGREGRKNSQRLKLVGRAMRPSPAGTKKLALPAAAPHPGEVIRKKK